jgi:hypothetical protein
MLLETGDLKGAHECASPLITGHAPYDGPANDPT